VDNLNAGELFSINSLIFYRNDPALLINQLHLPTNSNTSADKERELLKEKEFKVI